MEIGSNNCCNSKMAINGMTDVLKTQQGQQMGKKGGGNSDSEAEISSLGMMAQRNPNLSEATQAEMQAFRKEVMMASRTGEFNAEKLAEQAPDELKAYADEQGVDLNGALTQLNDQMGQIQAMGGMQGQGMHAGMMDSNGTQQEDHIQTLLDTLFGEENEEPQTVELDQI